MMKKLYRLYIVIIAAMMLFSNIIASAESNDSFKKKTMIEVASEHVSEETKQYLTSPDSYSHTEFNIDDVSIDTDCDFFEIYRETYSFGEDEDTYLYDIARCTPPEDILAYRNFTVTHYVINKNGYTCYIDPSDMTHVSFSNSSVKKFMNSAAVITVDGITYDVSRVYMLDLWEYQAGYIIYYYTSDEELYIGIYPCSEFNEYVIYKADEFASKAEWYLEYKKDAYSEITDFYNFAKGNLYVDKTESVEDRHAIDIVIVCIFSAGVLLLGAVFMLKNKKR